MCILDILFPLDIIWKKISQKSDSDRKNSAVFDMLPYYMCTVNVVAMLHNFWEQRQMSQSNGSISVSGDGVSVGDVQTESLLLYESAPSPGPPYICYVTLPGGSCFGNYKVCLSSPVLSGRISTLCSVWTYTSYPSRGTGNITVMWRQHIVDQTWAKSVVKRYNAGDLYFLIVYYTT